MTVRRDPYKNAPNRTSVSPQGKLENEDKNNQNLYVPPPSRKDEKNNLVRAEEMLENGAPPRPPLPRDEGRFLVTSLLCLPNTPQSNKVLLSLN